MAHDRIRCPRTRRSIRDNMTTVWGTVWSRGSVGTLALVLIACDQTRFPKPFAGTVQQTMGESLPGHSPFLLVRCVPPRRPLRVAMSRPVGSDASIAIAVWMDRTMARLDRGGESWANLLIGHISAADFEYLLDYLEIRWSDLNACKDVVAPYDFSYCTMEYLSCERRRYRFTTWAGAPQASRALDELTGWLRILELEECRTTPVDKWPAILTMSPNDRS